MGGQQDVEGFRNINHCTFVLTAVSRSTTIDSCQVAGKFEEPEQHSYNSSSLQDHSRLSEYLVTAWILASATW